MDWWTTSPVKKNSKSQLRDQSSAFFSDWSGAWSQADWVLYWTETDAKNQAEMVQSKWNEFANQKYQAYYEGKVAEWDKATRRWENASRAGNLIGGGTVLIVTAGGSLAPSYLALGALGLAKQLTLQLAFGAVLAGATSNGGFSGCGAVASLGGGALSEGPILAGPTSQGGGDEIVLYRGVPNRQPNYPDALKGIANPRGGPATVLEHTEGDTRSIWTSWTEDPITASDFALNGANKGVVLRYTFSRSSLTPSPNRYGELEWLVPFPVEGAEPTIVTKASPLAQW